MEPYSLVQDPFLRSALEVSQSAKDQCFQLIESSRAHIDSNNVSRTAEEDAETSQAQNNLHSHLAHLRGLNRAAVHRVRQTKQSTAEARAEVDSLHLRLQNLYYEQRHLRGEISACEGFAHKYQSLPLVPLEIFLTENPTLEDADESALMEARINHEHAEREALEQQRQGLLKKKQSLIAENKKRKDDLASLDQDLEKFIDAAKPIQRIFEKEY